MVDMLKRDLAPLSEKAWHELDEQASRLLKMNLIGRKFVDFSGPHGWQLAAVDTGRLMLADKPAGNVPWGMREHLPIIETRVPFTLNQMELDDIERGCKDPDLEPLEKAVVEAARFEDSAIFNGFKDGRIDGLLSGSAHKPLTMPASVRDYPAAVADGIKTLVTAGIGGPYVLILGSDEYVALIKESGQGYPPHKFVSDILEKDILISPIIKGGAVVSARGGDFELIVGQDYSLGYAAGDKDKVELFITASFTFRVLEPRAVVAIKPPK